MSEQRVTLVTGNRQGSTARTLIELALYAGILYFVVNPEKLGQTANVVRGVHDRIRHRISVWQTLVAIQSLPETNDE